MNPTAGKVLLLSSEGVGYGDSISGYQVLAAMLESLSKRLQKPAAIICWNMAVKLVAKDSSLMSHFKRLEEEGVGILLGNGALENAS